jgi:hypothetical protein
VGLLQRAHVIVQVPLGQARALSPGCVRACLALLGLLLKLTAAAMGTMSEQYCTNGESLHSVVVRWCVQKCCRLSCVLDLCLVAVLGCGLSGLAELG